jgi:hypothetical protein
MEVHASEKLTILILCTFKLFFEKLVNKVIQSVIIVAQLVTTLKYPNYVPRNTIYYRYTVNTVALLYTIFFYTQIITDVNNASR